MNWGSTGQKLDPVIIYVISNSDWAAMALDIFGFGSPDDGAIALPNLLVQDGRREVTTSQGKGNFSGSVISATLR